MCFLKALIFHALALQDVNQLHILIVFVIVHCPLYPSEEEEGRESSSQSQEGRKTLSGGLNKWRFTDRGATKTPAPHTEGVPGTGQVLMPPLCCSLSPHP